MGIFYISSITCEIIWTFLVHNFEHHIQLKVSGSYGKMMIYFWPICKYFINRLLEIYKFKQCFAKRRSNFGYIQ